MEGGGLRQVLLNICDRQIVRKVTRPRVALKCISRTVLPGRCGTR
jgi:hypothetical protein